LEFIFDSLLRDIVKHNGSDKQGFFMERLTLNTERLLLKEPTRDMIEEILHCLEENKNFHKPYEPIRPKKYYSHQYWENLISKIEENEKQEQGLQLFLVNSVGSIIGSLSFSNIVRGVFQACYLGFSLAEKEQGKGLMQEALRASIQFMFTERNIHRIMANYLLDNLRSERLLMRLGFEKEGIAKEYLLINGKWQDHILTSLVNKNWNNGY